MYAIPFFPEVMEHLFIPVGIKLENDSEVVSSARVGYAENVSLWIQVQIGVRVSTGHAAWKTVQNCELARRSYFENGAVVVSSTLIGGPIKISIRVLDQSSIGYSPSAPPSKLYSTVSVPPEVTLNTVPRP